MRLKAVVCELAMLPEMFSSANDCARIPVTAVVRAPKIPMTSSPDQRSGRLSGSSRHIRPHHRDGPSQAACQRDFGEYQWVGGTGAGPTTQICLAAATFAACGPAPVWIYAGASGVNFKRDAVHAIAQARGPRSVLEHVAEMAAAAAAMHLGARHSKTRSVEVADRVRQRLRRSSASRCRSRIWCPTRTAAARSRRKRTGPCASPG